MRLLVLCVESRRKEGMVNCESDNQQLTLRPLPRDHRKRSNIPINIARNQHHPNITYLMPPTPPPLCILPREPKPLAIGCGAGVVPTASEQTKTRVLLHLSKSLVNTSTCLITSPMVSGRCRCASGITE